MKTSIRSNRENYDHGLPFEKKLGENIIDLVARVKNNKASLIIIDGGVGEGKTTLAVLCADRINEMAGLSKIEFSEQLATGGSDFLHKLRLAFENKYPVVVYDEAGDFNRRGALTRFNAMLDRTFETFRAFRILVILALPSFHVLDSTLFDKKIPRMLIHCHSRTKNYGNLSGYSLYRMMHIRHMMTKLVVKSHGYDRVQANFKGHFLNLPEARCRELDKFTIKGKLDILKASETKIEGLIGYSEMARRLSRSINWCRQAINKLKIKPARVIKKAKYFEDEILNTLADYIDQISDKKAKKGE